MPLSQCKVASTVDELTKRFLVVANEGFWRFAIKYSTGFLRGTYSDVIPIIFSQVSTN